MFRSAGATAAHGRRSEQTQSKWRRPLPLHLIAAAGITLLLAVIISALAWQTYRGAQEALFSASYETMGRISEAAGDKVKRILDPAKYQLDLLASSEISGPETGADELREMTVVMGSLDSNALIDALYFAHSNGKFTLYRPLRRETEFAVYEAPANATLLVQSITPAADGRLQGQFSFFDAAGKLISRHDKPDYKYDARTRPWYAPALQKDGIHQTDPYVFFTNRQIGLTLSQRHVSGAVVGLDVTIATLASELNRLRLTPNSELAIVDESGRVLGYRNQEHLYIRNADGTWRVATIDELGVPPLAAAAKLAGTGLIRGSTTIDGKAWQLIYFNRQVKGDKPVKVLIAIPDEEFFAGARQIILDQLLVAGIFLALAIPVGWWIARRIARPLRRLVKETEKIRSFDFRSDIKVHSPVAEVEDLAVSLNGMKETIGKFLTIGMALAAEPSYRSLLDRVLKETIDLAASDGGAIFLMDEKGTHFMPELLRWHGRDLASEMARAQPIPLNQPGMFRDVMDSLRLGEVTTVSKNFDDTELDLLGLSRPVRHSNKPHVLLILVPLIGRQGNLLGALILVNGLSKDRSDWRPGTHQLELIRAVSGNSAVAIENQMLLQAQKNLMNALIKLIAGAIDAKSPYTGGHCQRVPVLTRMLAEAAHGRTDGPYANFALSEEEWEAVDIASWLHDCGKVTTPEYVIDKATKLETIYDRIHEVRMRFEVLKRDAEIDFWKKLGEGGDRVQLRANLDATLKELDDEFAFVATCNEGGEFMDPAHIDRLRKIAGRHWRRTLSDRIGIAHEEKARKEKEPELPLPVEEPLLADRAEHIIPHSDQEQRYGAADNPWGFRMHMPKYKFNRGEIYNLSVSRGTLTEEDRYLINGHMIQSIAMLESLPFPRHLKSVPELAGGHHEKMDGTGYPKRLRGGDMSPVARMMAIADVFEALTAADRPYKKAKPLSEAIRIMGNMKKTNHLDPDLVDLFLTSGVWLSYAQKFLSAEQIDKPDIESVLKIRPDPFDPKPERSAAE